MMFLFNYYLFIFLLLFSRFSELPLHATTGRIQLIDWFYFTWKLTNSLEHPESSNESRGRLRLELGNSYEFRLWTRSRKSRITQITMPPPPSTTRHHHHHPCHRQPSHIKFLSRIVSEAFAVDFTSRIVFFFLKNNESSIRIRMKKQLTGI